MSRDTFFFVHANGLCAEVWNPVITELSALLPHSRCHSLNILGHGNAAALPASQGLVVSWAALAADIYRQIHERCGERSADEAWWGVGHSLGGSLLLMIETLHPGSFSGLILWEPVLVHPNRASVPSSQKPLVAQTLRCGVLHVSGVLIMLWDCTGGGLSLRV